MGSMIVETLSKDQGILLGAILGSLAILAGTVVSVVSVLVVNWRKVRQTEDNNALKQSMLEMGMSAEEIAEVVGASAERRPQVHFRNARGSFSCQS